MKGIYIKEDNIFLKVLAESEAERIYHWYSEEKGYAHATGLNTGLSRLAFEKMWHQSVSKDNEFFLSINQINFNYVLGFIKGIVVKPSIVFISALAIDKSARRRRVGTKALNALLLDFKSKFGSTHAIVTVDSDNTDGLQFWQNNGFYISRTIVKKGQLENTVMSIVLLKKEI